MDPVTGFRGVDTPVIDDPNGVGVDLDDRVVVTVAGIHRRVDVIRVVRDQDLANDLELARVEGSIEHQVMERPTAIKRAAGCICDRRAHGFGRTDQVSSRIVDADADIEPGVAVDHVIAASPLDQIAAAAADEDVAPIKGDDLLQIAAGRRSRHHVAQEFAQTRDAIDASLGELVVGEDGLDRVTIGSRRRLFHIRIAPVVAAQDVIIVPSRERFDLIEAIPEDVLFHGSEDWRQQV